MTQSITIVYCTFGNLENLEKVCTFLLNNKLIACYNAFPINSCYWWASELQNDHEFVAILKTVKSKLDEINQIIESLHSYEIPCIIHWEVESNQKYSNWVQNQLI